MLVNSDRASDQDPMRTPSKAAPPLCRHAQRALVLALMLLFVACGGDSPTTDTGSDSDVDVDVTGEFTVAIVASTLSGNVPQRIDFSADITGGPDGLTLQWFIDDRPYTNERSFEIVFNRAGQTRVELVATDARGTRESDSVTVRLLGCGQLRFDRFTLGSPIEVAPGGETRVQLARLINEGDAIESPFAVALWLSLDDTFDPENDREIGRIEVASMAQGLTTTSAVDLAGQTFTVPEDMAPDTYYAFLVADPDGVVNECQELDNQLAASNALVVDPEADKLPDLRIDNLAVPEGTVVSQGRTLSWTYAITNDGEADARQFRFGFWLSSDTILDENDRVISSPSDDLNRVQLMPAGLSLGFFKTWLVPDDLIDGDYYILGRVDALETVAESDEANNAAVSVNTFTMRYEAPDCFDFALERVRVTPLTTYWGGTVSLELTVKNEGAKDAPAGNIARAYLSLTPTLSPANAQVVGNFTLDAVPAGETRTFELLVPIGSDLPVLPHYLGVVLDPTSVFVECTESNNAALFPDPVRINALAEVDVAVTSLAYHPRVVMAGSEIKVDFGIENRGTSAATSFQVGLVLSPDPEVSAAGVASGADVVIDRFTVPLLVAGDARSTIRDVVIPAGLDHRVAGWHVAVLADLDGFLTADINPANNARVAPETLTVNGAIGGCFDDLYEPNDTRANGRILGALGSTRFEGLGACGSDDWFIVDVPAGRSLFATVSARPIVSVDTTPSELVVELYPPDSDIASARSVAGPIYRAYAFGVGDDGHPAGAWAVRVKGQTDEDRAAYDLELELATPGAGVDLIPHQVVAAPSAAYAGGRLITRFRETNFGLEAAPARTVRVYLSTNRTFEPALDVMLGEVTMAALGPVGSLEGELNTLLSAALPPGTWYAIVVSDPSAAVPELDEDNNVAVSNPIFLDPLKVCSDDTFEPNDERVIATVVTAPSQTQRNLVVCPTLDDWFAFDLAQGDALDVDIAYNYEAAKGRLVLELYTPRGDGAVHTDSRNGVARVFLPSAWEAGRWYVRVGSDNASSPYTYEIRSLKTRGSPTLACSAERYEPNDSVGSAARIGCGESTGQLCNADIDWYRLPGKAGQRLTVQTTQSNSQLLFQLFLPGGTNAVGSIFGTGSMNYTPGVDGPVYLRITPRLGANTVSAFGYTFSVAGIDGAEVAVTDFMSDLSSLDRGEDLLLDFALENPCTLPAPAFEATVWLSIDDRVDTGDLPLYSLADPGLLAGESRSYRPKVTIPASTAPGTYRVLIEADSSYVLDESNELDNVAGLDLTVMDPCEPDRFEPNDDRGSASLVSGGEDELSLCPFDQDWFAIVSPAGASWDIAIRFAHTEGDLDLRVFDPLVSATLPVASSSTLTDDEAVTVSTPLATTLYVRVNGYGGARAAYELEVIPR